VSTVPKQNRREIIIVAAQEVFARKGREGATIDEIARRAGCSPSAIYKYFKNKQELHDLSMGHYFQEMLAVAGDRLPFDVSLSDHLRWMFGRLFKLFAHNTALIRTALVFESMGEEGYAQRRLLIEQLEILFAEAVERGELRGGDAKTYALAFAGMTNALLLKRLVEDNRVPDAEDVERMVEIFMYGVVPR